MPQKAAETITAIGRSQRLRLAMSNATAIAGAGPSIRTDMPSPAVAVMTGSAGGTVRLGPGRPTGAGHAVVVLEVHRDRGTGEAEARRAAR